MCIQKALVVICEKVMKSIEVCITRLSMIQEQPNIDFDMRSML